MKTFNSLMRHRDHFDRHWNQMVEVHDPGREAKPYWEDRCLQQLKMAGEYSKYSDDKYESLIEEVSAYVKRQMATYGYINEGVCKEAERRLKKIGLLMKEINVHCVSHAHIDMNWMWGYHETVEVVLATLTTMADLLDEYPDFTYAQSQASVYRIVELFDQDLLERIRKYVKEGRWEVTASTWVEHDKNMTGSESFARQLLYSRTYLSDLLEINQEDIVLGFEPDTFGHSASVPEILSQAGVKYYYHCRGLDDKYLYRWESPSGASLLAYREPVWYGNSIASGAFYHIPMLVKETNVQDTLFVYGVGDHGGGPSRQDISRLREMNQWPLMPNLLFSSYRNYFEAVEEQKASLPVVKGEINPLLTGCYTSTSRIKMANHYGENSLVSTEFAAAMANHLLGHAYDYARLEASWEKHMFNQFHDILPGCGINFTLEHAMGQFQEVIAANNVVKRKALEVISSQINTTGVEGEMEEGTADAAGHGVGFRHMMGEMGISFNTGLGQRGRFSGGTRLFALYNSTQYPRHEIVEVILWDYKQDISMIAVYGSKGEALPFSVDKSGFNQYWGHYYLKLMVQVSVEGFGYEVITISDDQEGQDPSIVKSDARKSSYFENVMENDHIKVTFDPLTMDIRSLYAKETGRELLSKAGSNFRYIKEESKEASAWTVGSYVSIDDCVREVTDRQAVKDDLLTRISFKMKVNRSHLQITYTLGENDRQLHVTVVNAWSEVGDENYTPQLQYRLNLDTSCTKYLFDVPMGLVERKPCPEDLPGLHFAYAKNDDKGNVYFATDSKYGYRATETSLALNLIRSSTGPNTHPDNGTHHVDFLIGVGTVEDAYRQAACLNNPLDSINIPLGQEGSLPMSGAFMNVDTREAIITSVKKAQKDDALVIKMYQSSGVDEDVTFTFSNGINEAYIVDLLENHVERIEAIDVARLTVTSKAYSVTAIKVYFGTCNRKQWLTFTA